MRTCKFFRDYDLKKKVDVIESLSDDSDPLNIFSHKLNNKYNQIKQPKFKRI